MNAKPIARFEEIVQRLVEGTFARLFAGRLRPLEVANALAHALEDHAVSRPGEAPLAPNHYWVKLNPEDHRALLAQQPHLANDLAQHLFETAQQVGFALPELPVVNLAAQPEVPLHNVQVTARWLSAKGDTKDSTRQMPAARPPAADADAPAGRPFLILEGRRHLPLTRTKISLGRSLDNDIIVDDARVSRRHAQLRLRYDRYVIYDLGSTGGTTVNGYPIQECVLEAGDVISLAGVEIIYGEDTPAPASRPRETSGTPAWRRPSLPDTGLLPPLSTDHPET